MTAAEEARKFDAADEPLAAGEAYEAALSKPEADLDLYLDAAVLYFECNDYGYYSYHKLPERFYHMALQRANEILDEAEQKFGWHPEIEFWRRYCLLIYEGGEGFREEAESLVESGETLVPSFYLISGPNKETYAEMARELRFQVGEGKTQKERYILSLLDASYLDRLLDGPPAGS